MSVQIIIPVIFLAIALSMDAFAVSITDGLIYQDLNRKKGIFIAATFGFLQGLMPLIGYWLIELIEVIVGESAGSEAGKILALVVTWMAFVLLIIIGSKMLVGGIQELNKSNEEKKTKLFSYKEVFLFGIATSIDALASGVALHSGLSNNITIFLHVSIIILITFIMCIIGVFLGNKIEKLLKGKKEITSIMGGVILILLAIWIVISHYLGL